VGHIGDSRAYRIRSGKIEQLSRDHSLVWELESGGLTREQAAGAAPKNIITRSMGPHAQVEVDLVGPFPIEDGDIFLLCSDGLSGQVTDEEIGLVAAELEPREAADALIGLALVRGAPDNVTVVVARAGPEEVSKASSSDEPWPLSDEPVASKGAANIPWKWLAISGASLFAALLLSPDSNLVNDKSLLAQTFGDNAARAISIIGSGAALLAAVASALFALLGFLIPPAADGRVLPLGRQLGKGPYRSYSCAASETLLEGILGSIEAAADGLADADRERTITILARARQNAAAHSFHEAMMAAAEALAIYKRTIEHSRIDQTAGGRG
jgi:protein phosphatase